MTVHIDVGTVALVLLVLGLFPMPWGKRRRKP